MNVRQVELVRGRAHLVAWVDANLPLKPGVHVIGKKDKTEWVVKHVYEVVQDSNELHTDWEVGGI